MNAVHSSSFEETLVDYFLTRYNAKLLPLHSVLNRPVTVFYFLFLVICKFVIVCLNNLED
jgi:hypothetical protein